MAPISNPKNEKAKSSYALLYLSLFILRPIQLNKFFLFSRPFWTVAKFLPCRSEAEKISWFRHFFFFLLINLVPRVLPFYIRTKFRLKNRVTTVHLLQCKTNFFIHLSFWGRNLLQIKEHPPWEASINIQKKFYWFVCTRLHSSTLVYIHVVTRLHSSTFVYWLVYIRLDSSVFRTDPANTAKWYKLSDEQEICRYCLRNNVENEMHDLTVIITTP